MTGDYPELMRQVAPLLGYDPRAADRKGVARLPSGFGDARRPGFFAEATP
jgi:hypothetical protein